MYTQLNLTSDDEEFDDDNYCKYVFPVDDKDGMFNSFYYWEFH